MRIFLFEYATCGEAQDSIALEGIGMFKTLYNGFKEVSEVESFAKPGFANLFGLRCTSNWVEDFEKYVEGTDCSLVIAPEDNFLLFELTKLVEKAGAKNLGSKSKGVFAASDKWLAYLAIRRKANMPKTSLKPLCAPYIVKPRVSCGGEGIRLDGKVPEGCIAQEFVKGIDVSVSILVGDEIRVVSVNRQIIDNFRYKGAIVPFSCGEEVVEEAIKAIEAIKGLFGYVGVDMVVGDAPYVIEVNPRITTPAILFKDVYGINLADLLIKNYEGKRIPEFKANKTFLLSKVRGSVKNAVVSFRGSSLLKEIYKNHLF